MKLTSNDGSDLMEVERLSVDGGKLVVLGTIMGAMPIEAMLTPAELRSAFRLLNLKTSLAILRMLFLK